MTSTKNKKVPKLRFPDFTGEWKREQFGAIADITSGGTPSRTNPAYWNGDINWVTTSEINRSFILLASQKITQLGLENSSAKVFPKNTILVAMYGQGQTRGRAAILGIEATTNQACAALKIKEFALPLFVLHNLNRRYDELRNLSNDGSQKNLSTGLIKALCIFFPSIPEQQKIADFLTSVDKKIEQLNKKKELLEKYKKGCMQKIFSQDIRFKDDNGNGFPDWEEKKLGDVCLKISSNISANTLENNYGIYKIYGATGYLQNVDFYQEEEPYISIVKDGAGVGRILLCEAKSSVLGTLDKLRQKNKNNLHFLYFLISQIEFDKYTTGSTIPHIYFKDYSKEEINLPHPDEQKKIAEFLSSIDKKIELVDKEIELAKSFKKGLLQLMFV